MRKLTIILIVAVLILPLLLVSKVNYLSEDEYKKLKKAERLNYWQDLETDLQDYVERSSDAQKRVDDANARIEELRAQIAATEQEHDATYNQILDYLEVDKNNQAKWNDIAGKIEYFNAQINDFNSLSDSELWQAKKHIYALREEWNDYRNDNYAKIPDFQDDIMMIENRLTRLETELESKRPKYYEDTYTVVAGETLSKISGYHFIYNDPAKWGIIYRANRDHIKDPNIINPDQVLKIPRGKPNTWKVYKGEFLWRIASYPEVYGNGAKWPLIYRANQDKIKDPDLIYPNQVFEIPRD
jgi:nucleoid-associated protein YgaU